MIKTNIATCPHCGSLSRRLHLKWWQFLPAIGRQHYRCTACKQYFWGTG